MVAVAIYRFRTAVTAGRAVGRTGRRHSLELGPADAGEGSGSRLAEPWGAQSQAGLRLGLAGVFLPKCRALRVVSLGLPRQLRKEPCGEKWGRSPHFNSLPRAQRCKTAGIAARRPGDCDSISLILCSIFLRPPLPQLSLLCSASPLPATASPLATPNQRDFPVFPVTLQPPAMKIFVYYWAFLDRSGHITVKPGESNRPAHFPREYFLWCLLGRLERRCLAALPGMVCGTGDAQHFFLQRFTSACLSLSRREVPVTCTC